MIVRLVVLFCVLVVMVAAVVIWGIGHHSWVGPLPIHYAPAPHAAVCESCKHPEWGDEFGNDCVPDSRCRHNAAIVNRVPRDHYCYPSKGNMFGNDCRKGKTYGHAIQEIKHVVSSVRPHPCSHHRHRRHVVAASRVHHDAHSGAHSDHYKIKHHQKKNHNHKGHHHAGHHHHQH